MQEKKLENTVEEITLAEDLSPLDSHPATWDNWNGISSHLEELKRSPRAVILTEMLSEVTPNRQDLWYLMFRVPLLFLLRHFFNKNFIFIKKYDFCMSNLCKQNSVLFKWRGKRTYDYFSFSKQAVGNNLVLVTCTCFYLSDVLLFNCFPL